MLADIRDSFTGNRQLYPEDEGNDIRNLGAVMIDLEEQTTYILGSRSTKLKDRQMLRRC